TAIGRRAANLRRRKLVRNGRIRTKSRDAFGQRDGLFVHPIAPAFDLKLLRLPLPERDEPADVNVLASRGELRPPLGGADVLVEEIRLALGGIGEGVAWLELRGQLHHVEA